MTANKTPPAAQADDSTPARLGALYSATVGGPAAASTDIISLIISILLPLIQGCFNKGATSGSIASAMKDRPFLARVAVRRAMHQAGVDERHSHADGIFRTIVAAGTKATAKDVEDLVSENSF